MDDKLVFLFGFLTVIGVLVAIRKFDSKFHLVEFLDSANRIIRRGRSTSGRVLRISFVEGETRSWSVIDYEFWDVGGKRHVNDKAVDDIGALKKGDFIKVYYLPDRPDKNTISRVIHT